MSKNKKSSDIKKGYYGYSSESGSTSKKKSNSKVAKVLGIIFVILQLAASVGFVALLLTKNLAFVTPGILAGSIAVLIVLLALVLFMLQKSKKAQIGGNVISVIVIIILLVLMYLLSPNLDKFTTGKKLSKKPFAVFVSAADTFGQFDDKTLTRSDTNLIAIVNPKQHNLLLVSTPRDYYVPVQAKAVAKEKAGSYSSYDKLTHVGLYGNGTATNSSGQSVTASDWQWAQEVTWNPGYTALMDTLKHLYNFNVTNKDYHYVKINFTGFADLIDALGGIDVNVDIPFSTKTYATYSKESPERKTYKYTKGKMEMDGATALTYARERHSFGSGDMTRNKNQVKVLKAIEKKLVSGSTLLHYNSVLDAVKNSFTTDMDISSSVGLLQDAGSDGWNIMSFSVIGTPSRQILTYNGLSKSVVLQDADSIARATKLMNMTLEGKTADEIKKQIKTYNKEQAYQ